MAPVTYVLEGPKWPVQTVTYSFATTTYAADAATPFSNPVDAADQSIVRQAFASWAAASGLKFTEVADSADATQAANIRIGFGKLDTATTQTVGVTGYHYATTSAGMTFRPDVVVRLEDPSQLALVSSNGVPTYQGLSTSFYQVALHEIGHALGLGHSTDPNSVMYATVGPANTALNAGDIAGIKALYGGGTVTAAATGTSGQLAATAQDTITFKLSGNGANDTGAIISIDGKQVGGVHSVKAAHALGLSTSLTFSGDYGAGPHTATVTSAGRPATPLFLDAVTLNGHLLGEAKAMLGSKESATFNLSSDAMPRAGVVLSDIDATLGQLLPVHSS